MQRTGLKAAIGFIAAIGLPLATALGYMTWRTESMQATVERYDREHALIYTIPAGASKQFKPIVDEALDFPDVITLTVGLSDTLRIKNADREPARAGPFKIDPGVTYRQRFQEPGTFPYFCDEDAADSLTVVVLPRPQ